MGAPPRVVFLTDIATPYLVAVLEQLAERVDLTALFSAHAGSRAADWAFDEPFAFRHRVLGGPVIRRPFHDGTDLHPNPQVLATLVRERPTAVISGGFSFPSLYAAIYGRLSRAPLIIHNEGTSHSERDLGAIQRCARIVLLRAAAACVGVSKAAANRFLELGVPPDRVFCAPLTTNIARFHGIARARVGSPRHSAVMTVLHVGRLIPRKGIDRLIRAVAQARRSAPMRLVLVGTGPEEPRLRQLAGELGLGSVVQFQGFVDQPDLPGIYEQADVFAFPTLDDPFGMVLLEAAATGLPVVASPFAGATVDLVEEGRSGFVIDPEDTRGWASALVALARDPGLRQRLGARGAAATLTRTPARAADGYTRAIYSALRRSAGTEGSG